MARNIDWNAVASEMKQSSEKKKFVREVDPNLYEPKLVDGSADVIVRFLPAPENESVQIATVYSHSFEVNGKWLIKKCPASLGRTHKCPVCEYSSSKWIRNAQPGSDDEFRNKETVKQFKKASYYLNVLIIKDVNTPENNGTVKIMRIPKKVYAKILNKMSPSEDDGDEPSPVLDFLKGSNFKLKIRSKKVPGYQNLQRDYDLSEFSSPSPLGDEKFINEIDKKLISLKFYIEGDIETYEKLQGNLDRVLGVTTQSSSGQAQERSSSSSPVAGVVESDDAEEEFLRKLREG
jgi:hypothetical protein